MRREKIANYFYFQEGPGVRNTQYTTEGVKLLNVANLRDGKIDLSNTERYISVEEAYGKYAHFLVDEGDFIIASSGIKVEYFDKKMGFAKKEHLPLCMNTSTIRFKTLNENETDIRYLMYYLKSNSFKAQLTEFITGSAQLNFGPSHLKKMTFPLVDLAQQKEIVDVLSKIDALLIIINKQLEELDLLVKAKFYEMFGDPVKSPKHSLSPIERLGDIMTGTTPSMKENKYYDSNDIMFIKPGDIAEEQITTITSSKTYLSENARLVGRIFPEKSVLVTCIGTIGKVGISTKESSCNQQINVIVPCKHVNYLYLAHTLLYIKKRLIEAANAPVVPILNKSDFSKIAVPLPPLPLQEQFAHFVEQTEKIKTKIKLSLEKLELLKQSLLQKYFG